MQQSLLGALPHLGLGSCLVARAYLLVLETDRSSEGICADWASFATLEAGRKVSSLEFSCVGLYYSDSKLDLHVTGC